MKDCVILGANHSLSSLHKALGEIASENDGYKYFTALQEHIMKIGNLPMRNVSQQPVFDSIYVECYGERVAIIT